jgi:hypothetical protein
MDLHGIIAALGLVALALVAILAFFVSLKLFRAMRAVMSTQGVPWSLDHRANLSKETATIRRYYAAKCMNTANRAEGVHMLDPAYYEYGTGGDPVDDQQQRCRRAADSCV